MFEQFQNIEILRLIGAFLASICLGWVLYVSAYVKQKNKKIEEAFEDELLALKNDSFSLVGVAKTETWFIGYKMALFVLIIAATVIGWLASWAVGQETVLSQIEDVVLAAFAAIIGGLVADRFLIHPIADGSFFEKVEVPITENFLKNGIAAVPEKTKAKKLPKLKKASAESPAEVPEAEITLAEADKIKEELSKAPPVIVQDEDPLASLTFDEKTKLIEKLRRML